MQGQAAILDRTPDPNTRVAKNTVVQLYHLLFLVGNLDPD